MAGGGGRDGGSGAGGAEAATGTLTVGRVGGFPLRIHWSWPLAIALIAWSLQSSYLPDVYPEWTALRRWAVAVLTAVLFFASVLGHELAHAFVARARGHTVQGITLFVFGGVSEIGQEARNARDEFWIAVVGPLSSLGFALALALGWLAARAAELDAVYPLAGYLAYVNVTVALFNLLPGFPLDGGRVLRAVLWARGGEELRATRAASRVGRAVAAGLAGLGLLAVFGGGALSGMWLVFIGWVLWNAADATYRERLLQVSLVGLRAGDLVDGTVAWVEPDTTLATLVRSRALPHGTRTFIVASAGGAVLGLVSLSDVQRVPESAWETTTVFRVMTPRERLVGVSADAEALAALRLMVEHDLNQLPVFAADGGLAGVLTRGALLQAIEVRARLSAGPRRS